MARGTEAEPSDTEVPKEETGGGTATSLFASNGACAQAIPASQKHKQKNLKKLRCMKEFGYQPLYMILIHI
jgi:hypothetical protein